MLYELIGGFVTILIGVNLMPIVANTVYAGLHNGTAYNFNISGAAITVTELVNIFFAIAVMSIGVALVFSGLRKAGLV